MYAKIVLFSFFFALAAVAEPQGNFHLQFLRKTCSNQLFTVPAAASSVISLAISDGKL